MRTIWVICVVAACGKVNSMGPDASEQRDAPRPPVDAAIDAPRDASCSAATGSMTFTFTGANQMFTVPTCVTHVTLDAYGGQGGTGGAAAAGKGGRATGTATVTPNEVLVIVVGGAGADVGTVGSASGFVGGFNGGGGVHEFIGWGGQAEGDSGTGGGASDVRQGGSALANRIIVAGGGGGGGGTGSTNGSLAGGDAGGATGMAGAAMLSNANGGGGGTQTAGGTATTLGNYPNQPGSLGTGGDAYRDGAASGGGGGGYYGGGGGEFGGGGGGASYLGTLTSATTSAGVRVGAGMIVVSW